VISRREFTLMAAVLASASAGAANAQGKWQPGKHYRLVVHPQPTSSAGKVEVAEYFWYGCGHCYALDPALEEWKTKKASYIDFIRVPAMWGPVHRQHAKLYYTLQALQRPELHSKAFDAIHVLGLPLSAPEEVSARAAQFAFVKDFGITAGQFDNAYDSMTVAMNLRKADALTQNLAIASVPTLVIQGKYATSVDEAGGETQLLALINDLAAGEKPR